MKPARGVAAHLFGGHRLRVDRLVCIDVFAHGVTLTTAPFCDSGNALSQINEHRGVKVLHVGDPD
jgi:hypothetical protein